VSTVIVTTYSKLTVAQDYELRKVLRSSGAKYTVVKNTLAERAAKGTKVEDALKDLSGVTSIATRKAIRWHWESACEVPKDNPEFTFKAGVVEGRVISIKEINALRPSVEGRDLFEASVPDEPPAQRLVTVMNAVDATCCVISQGVEKENSAERRLRGSIAIL